MNNISFRAIALYLRHTPIEKGKYRLLTIARPVGRIIGPSLGRRKIQTKHGFKIMLDLQDWIPQDIYLTGDFETTTSKIAKILLKPGDAVVDVGANIGYFTLLFAHCVGNEGEVYSFEPGPELAAKLLENLKLNWYTQVTLSNQALSDRNGKAQFHTGPVDNTGLSSLRKPRESSGSFEVQLSKFDDIPGIERSKIKLVKIDVEGAELQVLRGMEGFLREQHPALILEITDQFLKDLGDSYDLLLSFLAQFGYFCYVIGDGRVTLLENMQHELPDQWNALFVSEKMFGAGLMVS